MRKKQLKLLNHVMEAAVAQGNYVIVGGDLGSISITIWIKLLRQLLMQSMMNLVINFDEGYKKLPL